MQAIILAGGFGTRLKSVVPDLPKPMAPIGSRPFLEVLLAHLQREGIKEVVLSVGYRCESIMDHFGARYGSLAIRYSIESEPLGTGGAILNSLSQISSDSFLILNGDTFLRLDYQAMLNHHRQSQALMTIALKHVSDISRYGSMTVENDRITSFNEKKGTSEQGLINAGVYLCQKQLFERFNLPAVFSFETDFLYPHVKQLSPAAFVTDSYFIDIGIPEDYQRAQHELLKG